MLSIQLSCCHIPIVQSRIRHFLGVVRSPKDLTNDKIFIQLFNIKTEKTLIDQWQCSTNVACMVALDARLAQSVSTRVHRIGPKITHDSWTHETAILTYQEDEVCNKRDHTKDKGSQSSISHILWLIRILGWEFCGSPMPVSTLNDSKTSKIFNFELDSFGVILYVKIPRRPSSLKHKTACNTKI